MNRCDHRECAHPDKERFLTLATLITFVRTTATVALALEAARERSLALLLWALGIYWVLDIVDGMVARAMDQETRIGAVIDIMCDRMSAACFYLGYAWYEPTMVAPVGIYLAEFMVVDFFLSLAFLAWPISSPNYYYVVDRRIWWWNWSKPGKVVNSALFAVLVVWTKDPWLCGAVALGLLALKTTSLIRLARITLPVPGGCALDRTNDPVSSTR